MRGQSPCQAPRDIPLPLQLCRRACGTDAYRDNPRRWSRDSASFPAQNHCCRAALPRGTVPPVRRQTPAFRRNTRQARRGFRSIRQRIPRSSVSVLLPHKSGLPCTTQSRYSASEVQRGTPTGISRRTASSARSRQNGDFSCFLWSQAHQAAQATCRPCNRCLRITFRKKDSVSYPDTLLFQMFLEFFAQFAKDFRYLIFGHTNSRCDVLDRL